MPADPNLPSSARAAGDMPLAPVARRKSAADANVRRSTAVQCRRRRPRRRNGMQCRHFGAFDADRQSFNAGCRVRSVRRDRGAALAPPPLQHATRQTHHQLPYHRQSTTVADSGPALRFIIQQPSGFPRRLARTASATPLLTLEPLREAPQPYARTRAPLVDGASGAPPMRTTAIAASRILDRTDRRTEGRTDGTREIAQAKRTLKCLSASVRAWGRHRMLSESNPTCVRVRKESVNASLSMRNRP